MNNQDFSKMTNRELAIYCEENDIHVDSKNVSKPTKQEYIMAIEEKNAGIKIVDSIDDIMPDPQETQIQDNDIDDFLNIDNDVDDEKPVAKKPKVSRAEKRKKQWEELMALRRVIINSNDNSQTRVKNQIEFCTWGNRLIGHHTDRFIIGKPWHVREGALRNLENKKISLSIQDEDGNTVKFETVPAYVIQRLDNLSQEEIDKIAKRQIIRENSIENMV